MPIVVTSTRTIASNEVLTLEAPRGFLFQPATPATTTLTLAGRASLTTGVYANATIAGIYVDQSAARAVIEITTTGRLTLLSTHADNVFMYGVQDFGGATSFFNAGLLDVQGRVFVTGVYSMTSDFDFTNSGLLTVRGDIWAYGAQLPFNSVVSNSGLIEVHGGQRAIGLQLQNGNTGNPEDCLFINAGSIIARAGAGSLSIGVLTSQQGVTGRVDRYFNTGLISADLAFVVAESGDLDEGGRRESLVNHGQIEGDVLMGRGDDAVVNSGVMTSNIDFGEGADLYDGRGGHLIGAVFGGTGTDTLHGGDDDDWLFGEQGEDRIFGGGGDDLIDGGRDSDVIDGGVGFDTLSYASATGGVQLDLRGGFATGSGIDMITGIEGVIGSRFSDTMRGSNENETLEGRAGADVLDGRTGDDVLVGGAGDDTLTGGAGDDYFVISSGDGADTITDFAAGGGDDALYLYGWSAYRELRQAGNDTLVILSDTQTIRLTGVLATSLTAADFVFNPTALSSTITQVADPEIFLIRNEGFIIQAGETLAFTQSAHANALTIRGSLWVYESPPPPQTFHNAGTLSVLTAPTDRWAVGLSFEGPSVYLDAVILNAATGIIDVHSTNAFNAAGFSGNLPGGAIYNAGLIRVQSDLGSAYGLASSQKLFVNTGAIEVHAGESAAGVLIQGRQTGYNAGDIIVSGGEHHLGAATYGVSLYQSAEFTNTGRIMATEGTVDGFSIGLMVNRWPEGTTIFNSGLISGDHAVYEMTDRYTASATRIYNSGELRGAVSLLYGRDEVYNHGLINGVTTLFDGDDLFDGRGGVQGDVFGGEGADILLGGAGADRLDGGAGVDLVYGGRGVDQLTGGTGADSFGIGIGDGADVVTDFVGGEDVIRLYGYAGYQSITQVGGDAVITLSGTDSLRLLGVQAGSLTNANFVFMASEPPSSGIWPTPPTLPQIPTMPPPAVPTGAQLGSDGADILTGDGAANTLFGQGGDDQISGGGGDDILRGGDGTDTLRGGSGNDNIDGGDGFDVLIMGGNAAAYRLLEGRDGFMLKGAEGTDRLVGVEEIRFADGVVLSLSNAYGPDGWRTYMDGDKDAEPQVLPGMDDQVSWTVKGFGEAEVLPGPDEPPRVAFDGVGLLDHSSGQILIVDEQGLVVDHYGRSGGWGPDGWLF